MGVEPTSPFQDRLFSKEVKLATTTIHQKLAEGERVELSRAFTSLGFKSSAVAIYRLDLPYPNRVFLTLILLFLYPNGLMRCPLRFDLIPLR